MRAIIASLVMRRQCTTIVAKHPTTARATALPGPDAVDAGQGLTFGIPLAVKKVCLKLTGGCVIPNDLEAANTNGSDSAVRGMHDEVAARRPLIDVARHDGLRSSVILWDGLTLRQPAADEHVQWFQLTNRRGDHHASPKNSVALCSLVAGRASTPGVGPIVDPARRRGNPFRSEFMAVPTEAAESGRQYRSGHSARREDAPSGATAALLSDRPGRELDRPIDDS